MNLDSLDRKIIQEMSKGICSYHQLARTCNVSRNTLYRRVSILEKEGVIFKTTRSTINFDKLGITAISFSIKVQESNLDNVISTLKAHDKVKLLWKTFGDHNVILVAFCNKGEEGELIHELNTCLEKTEKLSLNISVGFNWEKMNLTPFSDSLNE
jgi:DNA-binding Lrp family transcriptional regulator